MKILLTGSNGQLGKELAARLQGLGELTATDRARLDLADPDAIRRLVRELQPGLIVNAAAYTAVDLAESQQELAMRVNGEAPGVLAEEAKLVGARLVHYSTDYVFDGRKATPYLESDAPHPLSVYGRSKLAGELAIAGAGCSHLILRTSWVYAPHGKNFFLTIARKAQAGENLRVVDDQTGVPTSASFLAAATVAILGHRATEQSLYHVVPGGHTTWCGFARAIVARLGAQAEVRAIRTEEYPTPARRPAASVLDPSAAVRDFGLMLPSWEALLDECVSAHLRDQDGTPGSRAQER